MPSDQTSISSFEEWEYLLNKYKSLVCTADNLEKSAPDVNLLPYEILESWKKCDENGLLPTDTLLPRNFSDTQIKRIRASRENKNILHKVRPIIEGFAADLSFIDATIMLLSPEGVCLHRMDTTYPNTETVIPADINIISDFTCGTNAHSFAMQKNEPVLLHGPYHFLNVFQNTIEIDVPIEVSSGEKVIGSLSVFVRLPKNWFTDDTSSLWKRKQSNQQQTSLDAPHKTKNIFHQDSLFGSAPLKTPFIEMLFTMVKTASYMATKALELSEKEKRSILVEQIFLNVLSCIDKGVVLVDEKGAIVMFNNICAKTLGLEDDEQHNKFLHDFIIGENATSHIALSGNAFNNLLVVFNTTDGPRKFKLSTRPLNTGGGFSGTIIYMEDVDDQEKNVDPPQCPKISFSDIVGHSSSMQELKAKAQIIASTDAPILLIGEVGCGKDTFAKAIHNSRFTSNSPFVALNCSGLVPRLAQEELFGYEYRGEIIPGKIEQADKGTLYLDQIHDLPMEIQGMLLRVLDEKTIARTGDIRRRRTSFRLICASQVNLEELVNEGKFRADLYYRISVAQLIIPPLREREGDTILLANDIIRRYCESRHILSVSLTPEVKKVLESYHWPGNVRQLRTCINYASDVCQNGTIALNNLPDAIQKAVLGKVTVSMDNKTWCLKDNERQIIVSALEETNHNVPKAAKLLGMGRSTLYKKIKKYNIFSSR